MVAAALASDVAAQSRHLSYELDLRPPLEGDAKLGVDFDVRLDVVSDPASTGGHALDGSAFARGFRALGEAAGDVNHIALGVDLGGRYITQGNTQLAARQVDYFAWLLDQDAAGGGPGLTPEQTADLNRLTTLRRRYYGYKLVYQHESDQDLERGQHVLGVQLVGELPLLHELLDVLPSATRLEEGFAPQPVRLGLGIDFVAGVDSTFAGPADPESELWRLRFEAVWSTKVFEALPLGVTWQGHYLFAEPQAIATNGRTFNSFLEVWALLPFTVSGRSALELKYLRGRMPPDYDAVDGAELGFSLAFY